MTTSSVASARQRRLGVDFQSYGVTDYSAWALAAHVINVDWSDVVDLDALSAHPDREKWDAALTSAISALGITPTQEQPGWILCAYYG
jgi:hypothetical protein